MQNLLNELKTLLSKEEKYISEGILLKNVIIEDTLKLEPSILKLLLSDKGIKKHFFREVEGIYVFDKINFQKFVSNKQFLPDSYTAFKNKIGLTTGNEYISEKKDVVLSWPYKDCVLEGGQDKEDAKRDEVFWNETLAPDEIDRLLSPKVLTNWKKYDKEGEHTVDNISDDDNLIIKGNNLLGLSSIIKKYRGKVKLIYIDPPYNIGGDSFKYNDSFNHSTWLTFTRNRLLFARDLLKKDGAIFVHIDHHELAYLNILLDEVFGIDNKVQLISIKTASPAGFKTVNPGPIDVTEYILFYTKNKKSFNFKKNYVPVDYNKNYNLYVEKKDNIEDWVFTKIQHKIYEVAGFSTEKEFKHKYGEMWKSVRNVLIQEFAFNNAENIVSVRDPHKPTAKVKELMKLSKDSGKVVAYKRENGSNMYLYKGGALAFYSNKKMKLDGKDEITELLTDFWNHISWAGIAKEGGVQLKNGKKPEKLIKQLINIVASKGDTIIDYHLGSGTTCAVAHKMGLKYIGIEQLDYGKNDSLLRLNNVINGDLSGVSNAVNWQGGGSFLYCELAKTNQEYINKITKTKNTGALKKIWKVMQEKAFISYNVDIKSINDNFSEFNELSLEDQKHFLIEVLDKNMLYVPYSEIDDVDYKISDEDKKLNKLFYGDK